MAGITVFTLSYAAAVAAATAGLYSGSPLVTSTRLVLIVSLVLMLDMSIIGA
jgi:hypothetical protein